MSMWYRIKVYFITFNVSRMFFKKFYFIWVKWNYVPWFNMRNEIMCPDSTCGMKFWTLMLLHPCRMKFCALILQVEWNSEPWFYIHAEWNPVLGFLQAEWNSEPWFYIHAEWNSVPWFYMLNEVLCLDSRHQMFADGQTITSAL